MWRPSFNGSWLAYRTKRSSSDRRCTQYGCHPTAARTLATADSDQEVDCLVANPAQTEITFSNSMIESWWRVLKHQWLYLHPSVEGQLDILAPAEPRRVIRNSSVATLRPPRRDAVSSTFCHHAGPPYRLALDSASVEERPRRALAKPK